MAQEKILLPELNDSLARNLRISDSNIAVEYKQGSAEEETKYHFQDVDFDGNRRSTSINNNIYSTDKNDNDFNNDNNKHNDTDSRNDDDNNISNERNNDVSDNTNGNVYRTTIHPKSSVENESKTIEQEQGQGIRDEGQEVKRDETDESEDVDFGVLIVEFSQLTGEEDQGRILAVLEKHNWKLEAAVSAFLDEQDSTHYYHPTYTSSSSSPSPFPSPYHSNASYNRTCNSPTSYMDNDQFTTTTTTQAEYDRRNYNSDDESTQIPRDDKYDRLDRFERFNKFDKFDKFDESDENDNDLASTYANPDTRQDVSEDEDDESYMKSYGFPSTTVTNKNDQLYEPSTSTSTTTYDKDDYAVFTIEDQIENKKEENDNIHKNNTSTYNHEYNYENNSNTNTTHSNKTDNYRYTYEAKNSNNNTTQTKNNDNDYPLSEKTIEDKNISFNNFSKKIAIEANYEQSPMGFNAKYYCQLVVPGSGWTSSQKGIVRVNTSLKLLCVEQLTGLIITHEKLIELLQLCDLIDCYAFHQLVLGTASHYYFSIRTLPSFQKVSEITHSRIRSFVSDGW